MTGNALESPHFRPWVGAHYMDGGLDGLRILVLGESHYDWTQRLTDCPDETDLTCFCVEKYQRTGKHQFWTRVTRLIVPDARRLQGHLWDYLAYYNFVQTLLAKRQRPTEEMWRSSVDSFYEVLAELQPRCVIVLGKSLWLHMPGGLHHADIPVGIELRPARSYPIPEARPALSTYVNHPRSRGFSLARWQPVVDAVLISARAIDT